MKAKYAAEAAIPQAKGHTGTLCGTADPRMPLPGHGNTAAEMEAGL